MWSFGTILIELFCGVPIFSGEDESEQLAMIMEYKGNPPLKMLLLGNRTKTFFDSEFHLNKKANSKGQVRVAGSKSLESFVKSDDKKFIDFLKVWWLYRNA
jgi:dual specificity tyrosine-phosphorylation-regulated kinase 2/3/4